MKIIEDKIKESEMTSDRKDSLMYSAQLLCEAFYLNLARKIPPFRVDYELPTKYNLNLFETY